MQSKTTGSITECTFRIRSQEVDAQKRIRTSALIMLMQEASMENVLNLKVSLWDLSKDQVSWVILRKRVEILNFPLLGESIVIKTFPAGFDRVLAYRDYLVYNSERELLATGQSTWTLMNMTTRKLQRIPAEYFKWSQTDESLGIVDTKLILTEHFNMDYEYTIRMSDLDWNNHVNNIILSKLMIQGAPEDLLRNNKISSYTFHIKSECFLNERLKIYSSQIGNNESHHRILSLKDNRLIAKAKCEWI